MNIFFRNIYSWFNGNYHENLYLFLKGDICPNGCCSGGANLFGVIGGWTTLVSLVVVLLYYYIVNHPRWNRWWHWLIALIVNAILNLIGSFAYTKSLLNNGQIGDCYLLMNEEIVIFNSDCFNFALGNMIIASGLFIIFTALFKRWSRNCNQSPWKKIRTKN